MSRNLITKLIAKHGPMTVKQIAALTNTCDSTIRTCLNRARAKQHGTKFFRIVEHIGAVPVYDLGPDPDYLRNNLIADSLEDDGPATIHTLAARLGKSANAIDSMIARLRAGRYKGKFYIVGWKLARGKGGRESPIYAFGLLPDAPRPDFSDSQRQSERRRAEKRRIEHVRAGGRVKPPRDRSQVTAGFFDGLLR